MNPVYVLVEYSATGVDPITAEVITAARPLGDVHAVVVGEPGVTNTLAPALAEMGAVVIVAAESDTYASRQVLPEVDALAAVAAAEPGPIVVAEGIVGNEVAGRLAARLGSGVLCDVVSINPDRTATQSILGDTHQVSSAVGGACPVYAVRPGAVTPEPIPAAGAVTAIAVAEPTAKDVVVHSFTPAAPQIRPDLASAKVVVAGGRGVGSAEGFATLCEPLADALGGAVGCTRDAVDENFYGAPFQIGQTGVSVAPDLYIGLGVSGAIQHKAGMQTARTIVVVNSDEDAPIFDIADFGVVGDVHTIVPALVDEINARRS